MGFADHLDLSSDGNLQIGGCDTVALAARYGTPLYVMDEQALRHNCRRYVDALRNHYPGESEIAYAGKAFLTRAMSRLLHEEGLSLDVVSGGEIYTALDAGYPPEKLLFHGSNKATDELNMAVDNGIGRMVVDNLPELRRLVAIAGQRGTPVPILLRIRPGVEANTHDSVETGRQDSKFGLGISDEETDDAVQLALSHHLIDLRGFHCHIGSQIMQLQPFRRAAVRMMNFTEKIRDRHGFTAGELNIGGGLGIRYRSCDEPPGIDEFVRTVSQAVSRAARDMQIPLPRLILEPGRSIVGEPGITLYRVGTIKDIPGIRCYVSVDGGMADNLRPALYDAEYEALLANRPEDMPADETMTVVGKACESGDVLIKEAVLPPPRTGDLLAVLSTGAYCYAMASNYNRNPRPPVVFAADGSSRVVVHRERYEDLTALDEL